jgi:hypothetical protein
MTDTYRSTEGEGWMYKYMIATSRLERVHRWEYARKLARTWRKYLFEARGKLYQSAFWMDVQQAADKRWVQHVVTTDVAAMADVVDKVETAAECNSEVGWAWAPPPDWLLGEGRELLAGTFIVFLMFFASLAPFFFSSFFAIFAFLAFSFSFSCFLRASLAE